MGLPSWVPEALRRAWGLARFLRGRGLEPGPVTLDRSRVFVLPTGQGVALALGLVALFMGSVNYDSSLGLLLTFWLGSLAFVSIVHTYHDLAHLELRAGQPDPVFAGELARFPLFLEDPSGRSHRALRVRAEGQGGHDPWIEVGPEGSAASLSRFAAHRGRLPLGCLTVWTRYPLGLFRAWAPLELDAECLVYPVPGPPRALPAAASASAGEVAGSARGAEDFGGLRGYLPGDSPRSVHWRASARTETLLTKLWSGGAPAIVWLSWDDLAASDPEERLSALCRWVLDAHGAGLTWGLRLPEGGIEPAAGDAHLRRCLTALALWEP